MHMHMAELQSHAAGVGQAHDVIPAYFCLHTNITAASPGRAGGQAGGVRCSNAQYIPVTKQQSNPHQPSATKVSWAEFSCLQLLDADSLPAPGGSLNFSDTSPD